MEHKGSAPARRTNARTQPAHDALNATPATTPYGEGTLARLVLVAYVFDTRVPHVEFT